MKIAEIAQCFRNMCRVRKVLKKTDSALIRKTLQQEYESLLREIKHLEERVGMRND